MTGRYKKMKKGKSWVIILVAVICIGLLGWYSTAVITDTKQKQEATANGESTKDKDYQNIKLGLDLSGGVSITYHIKDKNPSDKDVNDTIAKLEERAESYTTEYSVYKSGDDRITVEIPGVDDPNKVLEDLGSPGSLYFIAQYDSDGNANYTQDTSVEGGYKLNYDIDTLKANGSVILDGNDVKDASAQYDQSSSTSTKEPVVSLKLKDKAIDTWADATKKAKDAGQSIGIYYDDHFISVPTVSAVISDGNCVINGMKDYDEATSLATFIRVGAINLQLEELESNVVGAQLGGTALTNAVKAAIIGIILIMIFMIVLYGILGVVASIGLALYSMLTVLFIYWFEITLTLPGIAGIILGIGMAVDANVIVFARIREEIAGGKSVLAAVNEGYKKALSAILDGQVTTFIAALVLMVLGSGTVKGFAYTLMISIILSLFTALFIAKYLTRAFYGVGVRAEKFYGKAKKRKVIRFVQNRVKYFVISGVVIRAIRIMENKLPFYMAYPVPLLYNDDRNARRDYDFAGIGGMIYFGATSGNALNYSLEFVGGTSTTADFGKDYTAAEVEKDIVPSVSKLLGNSAVQVTTVQGSHDVTLKTRTLSLDERQDLAALLEKDFNVDASTIETQSISSTISGEMRTNAVKAVIISCIFMLLYIWFRFKDIRFASSAILALVHDVLVVVTAYALIRISVGSTFIACILTIVGYSVNDTIVIFDRIRENLHGIKKYSADELADIANESLTQTLSRSINTSLTTFVMVLLLFIFGHTSIREFSLPLMVGVLCGTYSSICIATELWYVMKLYLGKSAIKKQAAAPAKVSKKAKN